MSKKKHKKLKKQKDIYHIRCDELADDLLTSSSGETMTIEFTYEGRIYKGTVPCVGIVERDVDAEIRYVQQHALSDAEVDKLIREEHT